MIYQKIGVITLIRQQQGVIWQQQGVILVVVYSKRWYISGRLISAGLDGLPAMERQHQHHQHMIGSGFVLALPRSGLLGNATWKSKKKSVEVILSSRNHCRSTKTKYSFWPAQTKNSSTWPRRANHQLICHVPIAKRPELLQLFFLCHLSSAVDVNVAASVAPVFKSAEVTYVF